MIELNRAVLLDNKKPEGPFQKQALRALKLMYPLGVSGEQQHKDTILIYLVGWGDGLKASGQESVLTKFQQEVKDLLDPAWRPGASWIWW